MDQDTFDDLCEKKLGGEWAYFTLRARVIHGSVWMMKDFDKKIIDKYFSEFYSSEAKDNYKLKA